MKFAIALAFLLFGGINAESGYTSGNIGGLTLPKSISTSTTTTTSSVSVSVPNFPAADVSRLNELRDGSSQVSTEQLTKTTITRAQG